MNVRPVPARPGQAGVPGGERAGPRDGAGAAARRGGECPDPRAVGCPGEQRRTQTGVHVAERRAPPSGGSMTPFCRVGMAVT